MKPIVKPIDDVNPILVSKQDACRILGGICLRTVDNMIRAKKLPVRRIGRRTFVPYSALAKFGK